MKKSILSTTLLLCIIKMISASPVDMMIGARGYGFGGAYSAIVNDPSASYWNPSRLSHIDHISLMESNWILQDVQGMNVNYVSFAMPLKHVGTISGSWLLNHANLEFGEFNEDGTLKTFSNSANENTFSIAMGRQLFEKFLFLQKFSIGFTINRFTFNTNSEDGAGSGFDLGMSTEFPLGFSLGFTARNMGAEIMGYKLDPSLRLGLGYSKRFKEMHRITVGLDGEYIMNRDYSDKVTQEPARNNIKGFGGVEYSLVFSDFEIALRGGGYGMALHNTIGNYSFSGGFGFTWLGYSLQYAFMGATDRDASLGYGHRICLVLQLDRLFKDQNSH
ncbi:MAG: PorV/PorQ family protein [Chitinispirillaceae bacterium]|nr:PorV/PorQ family protein [Chitinispirillaceae bacterium]